MKEIARWLVSLGVTVGSLILLILLSPMVYANLGLTQTLRSQETTSFQYDGFTVLLCILLAGSMYIFLRSLSFFVRENWKVIKKSMRLTWSGIMKVVRLTKTIKRKFLESLEKFKLKRRVLNKLQEKYNFSEEERSEIFDSLLGLSLEDLHDIIHFVWRSLV